MRRAFAACMVSPPEALTPLQHVEDFARVQRHDRQKVALPRPREETQEVFDLSVTVLS